VSVPAGPPADEHGSGGERHGSGLPVGDLLDTGTVSVDLPVPTTALAIGAHPDDVEFGAGATVAKWSAAGCQVHHLVLTDGSKGSWDADEDLDRLVEARMDECRTAAAVLAGRPEAAGDRGVARVHFLGRVDGELDNDAATRREVARIIRQVRPDIVLGHDPWRRYRLHPDHRAAGFLTLDAVVAARDPHFFADLGLAPHRPGALLLFEPDLPNHVERADGFDLAKAEALLCHRSQLESTMGVAPSPSASTPTSVDAGTGPDGVEGFRERIRWQLAQHGALAGVAAGEAFRLIDQV